MNDWLQDRPEIISGVVYDLGGAGRASFMDVVKIPDTFCSVDLMADANPTIVADIEKPLPIPDAVSDTTMLFSTLEHVFDFQHVASEMARITKPGGKALIYSPMLIGFHTHKGKSFYIDDYFRYTRSALERIFRSAGFTDVEITPMGGLGWVIADLLMVFVRFNVLRVPVALMFGGLEHATRRLRNFDSAEKFPLAYMVVARR